MDKIDWPGVWSLAKKHSLEQFVYAYMETLLENQKPEGDLRREISNRYAILSARMISQELAIDDIHSILETAECYHLFFKGAVTRRRYKNPSFRTMGDIDFLYNESQHVTVKKLLLANNFSDYRESRKNDIYYRKPYVCVEAHRQLVPSESRFYSYCSQVWDRAHVKEGCRYCFEMSVEDEFIFNLIHLAFHFLEGGAGIRFIMDVFIYNHLEMDFDYVCNEFKKLDLLEFYHNISNLAESWFGQGVTAPVREALSKFVLENGTFGTAETSSSLAVREGRLRYLRKMCFPSYKEMCSVYPWLKGRKVFLPVAWSLRGFRVLRRKKGKLKKQIIKAKRGNKILGQELHQFLVECGLRSTL